jgi:hypothetical protein
MYCMYFPVRTVIAMRQETLEASVCLQCSLLCISIIGHCCRNGVRLGVQGVISALQEVKVIKKGERKQGRKIGV